MQGNYQKLPTTQDHLDILDIKENIVFTKTGACAVIKTSSINFDLLSEREQDAMIESFSGMLNSLTYPIQVVVRTKQLNIRDYIEKLDEQAAKQTNDFLKERIIMYKEYIDYLASRKDVLDKEFYIVVPYFSNSLTSQSSGFFSKNYTTIDKETIKYAIDNLNPKIDHVIKLMYRIGLRSFQLNTQELVELYYDIYNPSKLHSNIIGSESADFTAVMVEGLVEEK